MQSCPALQQSVGTQVMQEFHHSRKRCMKGWKRHSLQTDAQSPCLEAFPRDNGHSPKHSDANP